MSDNQQHQDFEDSHQPSGKALIGGAVVGAVLGLGALGGLANALGLPGGLFLFLGALFGAGIGLSLTSILAQARVNSSI